MMEKRSGWVCVWFVLDGSDGSGSKPFIYHFVYANAILRTSNGTPRVRVGLLYLDGVLGVLVGVWVGISLTLGGKGMPAEK